MTEREDGWGEEWDHVADVVVVGSGVAGMTAAVAASSRGASVVVLERGAFTGGTTAKSGGVLWIPNNPLLRERGLTDERADALRYMARTAYPTLYNPGHGTLGLPADKHALLEAFYDHGSVAIEELLASGALVLESLDYPVRREYPNLLLFMIWDEAVAASTDPSRFRFPVPAPGEHYDFVITAPTFADLGLEIEQRLGKLAPWTGGLSLDASFADGLAATIARFDALTRDGSDPDFHRGETPIEQAWSGAARPGAATGAMHPFAPQGPYHCVILGPGALDTKGGPVVDDHARVLTPAGEPIVGLYGAGNCIASPAGQAYWGAGGTIGLALTYGYLAGCHAAAEPARAPG